MPFSIRPHRRFPICCPVTYHAGLSTNGLMHNMDVMEIRPKELHAIVLRHGHADLTQGLMGKLERVGARKMPLLVHPDAFLERKLLFPDSHEIRLPLPIGVFCHGTALS